jgi:hypothetical protein
LAFEEALCQEPVEGCAVKAIRRDGLQESTISADFSCSGGL